MKINEEYSLAVICQRCHSHLPIKEISSMDGMNSTSIYVDDCPQCYQILNKMKENAELISKLSKGD